MASSRRILAAATRYLPRRFCVLNRDVAFGGVRSPAVRRMTFTPRNYNHQLTGSEHHVTGSEHHVIGSEHRVTGSGHQAAQLKPEVAPHVAITVNQQRSERDVKKLLQLIRPAWNTDHVTFQALGGGFINKTIRVLHRGDTRDGLVVRVNGALGEKAGISRSREVQYIRLLNRTGLGVPLVASFENGLVSTLVPGTPLDRPGAGNTLTNPGFIRKLTRLVARMNTALPEAEVEPELTRQNHRLVVVARSCLRELREVTDHDALNRFTARFSWDQLEAEVDFIYTHAQRQDMPTGLCHNDLWHPNLIYHEPTDTLSIIDYELMGVNFLPFDVAAFLRILSSSHILPGLPVVPGVDARFRRVVLRCYLEALAELQGRPADSVTPALVNQYLNFSQICELLYLVTEGILMIYITWYQDQHGGGEAGRCADCLQTSNLWIQEYFTLKAQCRS